MPSDPSPKNCAARRRPVRSRNYGSYIEARVREIVLDADREMIFRRRLREIVEHRFDHRRREFFRRQTVTPADDLQVGRGPSLETQ